MDNVLMNHEQTTVDPCLISDLIWRHPCCSAAQVFLINLWLAMNFWRGTYRRVLWLLKKKKKKKEAKGDSRLMGVRWKRGFRSSCFHHPSAGGCWERGRVIAAGVNLPDLLSLTAAILTINLNLPRRTEFVHIWVLAGGGRKRVVMQ